MQWLAISFGIVLGLLLAAFVVIPALAKRKPIRAGEDTGETMWTKLKKHTISTRVTLGAVGGAVAALVAIFVFPLLFPEVAEWFAQESALMWLAVATTAAIIGIAAAFHPLWTSGSVLTILLVCAVSVRLLEMDQDAVFEVREPASCKFGDTCLTTAPVRMWRKIWTPSGYCLVYSGIDPNGSAFRVEYLKDGVWTPVGAIDRHDTPARRVQSTTGRKELVFFEFVRPDNLKCPL